MSAKAGNDYAVMGDLGEGRYIVRMFVGKHAYDEELDGTPETLHEDITRRMGELAKQPDPDLAVDAERPRVHPGHAIIVPGHPIHDQSIVR